MNVIRVRHQFVAVITTATDLGGSATQLHLMTSDDGVTWNLPRSPLLSASSRPGAFDRGSVYRGSLATLPARKGRVRLGLWYSASDGAIAPNWRMGYTEVMFG